MVEIDTKDLKSTQVTSELNACMFKMMASE